jgi:hypothetical protein
MADHPTTVHLQAVIEFSATIVNGTILTDKTPILSLTDYPL